MPENENNLKREKKTRQEKTMVFDDTPKFCNLCNGSLKFNGHGSYICEECGNVVYDDFGKIRKFLDEHGPSPAAIISEGTGVTIAKINRFLRQGRIEIPDGSGEYIRCENCGEAIRYGRFCPACAATLSKNMTVILTSGDVGEKPRMENKGKMHTEKLLKGRDR